MESRDEKIFAAALGANDYRTFLKKTIEASSRNGRSNFSALSRKAGFSSRGFIPEVIDGRRRLTGNSFPKIVRALALPSPLKTYFSLLVAREEPDLNYEGLNEQEIDSKLTELRLKFQARLKSQENAELASSLLFKSHHVLTVYAVLGSKGEGVTIGQITARTGLAPNLCESVVRHLVAKNVVSEHDGRFRSLNPLYIFEGLGENHGFKASYLESLAELRRKATSRFNANDQLFLHSYFSVDRRRLPELKKRMRDLIEEFVESNEHDDGDCVAKVLVGLYS